MIQVVGFAIILPNSESWPLRAQAITNLRIYNPINNRIIRIDIFLSLIHIYVILVADRGYENYNIFAHAIEKGWKFAIRVKDKNSNGIRCV